MSGNAVVLYSKIQKGMNMFLIVLLVNYSDYCNGFRCNCILLPRTRVSVPGMISLKHYL